MNKPSYLPQFYSLMQQSNSWNESYNYLCQPSVCQKTSGELFEGFAKYYFLTEPACKSEYKNVWLFNEVPHHIKTKLGLGDRDYGTDLVLENYLGELSLVQCKFRTTQDSKLSWTKDKLANLFADSDKADYYIIFTNVSGIDAYSSSKKANRLRFIGLSDLLDLPQETFENMKLLLLGKETKYLKKQPRDYQLEIIETAATQLQESDRGQLILPCGTGKTLVSLWIKEKLDAKRTIVLVPSLALLRQTKHAWVANQKEFIPYLCICSEKDIDKNSDSTIIHMPEIGGNVSTDLEAIKSFFLKYKEELVIYCTYQSLEVLCNAATSVGFKFDLAICDEAHKTAGNKRSKHSLIHSDSNIRVSKRLYMTATPRIISNSVRSNASESIEYLYDMDNKEVFGQELYRMSFKEAIEQEILVDYQVVAMGVDDEEVSKAIKNRSFVSESETIDEIANNYALQYFMDKYDAHHAITFHSSVKKAQAFGLRHPT